MYTKLWFQTTLYTNSLFAVVLSNTWLEKLHKQQKKKTPKGLLKMPYTMAPLMWWLRLSPYTLFELPM